MCSLLNNSLSSQCHSPLFVVLPQILPFDFGEEPINSGDMTSVSCSISKGDLPLQILWTFNDKPVQSGDGVSVTFVTKRLSALSIDSVQAEHAGKYACIASNDAGFAAYSSHLNVNGRKYVIFAGVVFFYRSAFCYLNFSSSSNFTFRFRRGASEFRRSRFINLFSIQRGFAH